MVITSSHSVGLSVPLIPKIERVETFKLLGTVVSSDLKWNSHIAYVIPKANSRIHLRQLKRAAVPQDDMLYFYKKIIGIIRPVLEYAVAVWHNGLTADLSDQLELIQKRALRIIFGGSSFTNKSYDTFCHKLHISPLSARREDMTTRFFHILLDPASCLHYDYLVSKRGIILK